MKKLYRTPMAEISGMTSVQLDYLVRMGFVAPDLGDQRKHYSPFEAALVLIAGQLLQYSKDQSDAGAVIQAIRDIMDVKGVQKADVAALDLLCVEQELRDSEGALPEQHWESWVARHFILSQGLVCNVVRQEPSFMRLYCDHEGLDYDQEFAASSERVLQVISEMGWQPGLSFIELVMRSEFAKSIWSHGNFYLQVARNDDGSAEVKIDSEPAFMSDRVSWLTMNVGPLFKRLRPYLDGDMIRSARDYLDNKGVSLDGNGAKNG